MKEYYYDDLNKLIKFIVGRGQRVKILDSIEAQVSGNFEYIVVKNLVGNIEDLQEYFMNLRVHCNEKTRLVVTYYNHLWEPILKFASWLGWRKKTKEQNWLNNDDLANLLNLSGYEVINKNKRLLLPIYVPFISKILNGYLGNLPLVNGLCLSTWIIARSKPIVRKEYSVSIIVPARNEEGNIPRICKELPKFGLWQELIFVEGHSKDNTWGAIQVELAKKRSKKLTLAAFRQRGIGKADAVRLGFEKAKGDILMILDADLTVAPRELPKFYEAIASGYGEFANGTRLIYPMEKQAMRFLNKIGNCTFSYLFSWILGQRFSDTLCGTKVLLKENYEKIRKNRKMFGDFDPFGDYDLIFGAVKQNLKVTEIPIRYRERTYGQTNISRFKHGLLLLNMTRFAFNKFRAW